MGSRAVVVVCRDAEVAARRFHIDDPVGGAVYTRTGRAFFPDAVWQARIIERTRDAIAAADLWDGLDTDWLALDTELLPWSAKAGDLIRSQYAAVGAAGHAMTARAGELLSAALGRGADVADLVGRTHERAWPSTGLLRPTGSIAGRSRGPTTSGSPRSCCSRQRGICSHGGTTAGTCQSPIAWSPLGTGLSVPPGTSRWTCTIRKARQPPSRGGRSLWATVGKGWSSNRSHRS